MIVRGHQYIKDINFPSEPYCSRSVLLLLNRGNLLIKNFWDIWSVSVELVYYFSQTTLGNYRLCPNRRYHYLHHVLHYTTSDQRSRSPRD